MIKATRRYSTVVDKKKRPTTYRDSKSYHNTRARGENGENIRPFVNPRSFHVDPWCGCCIVYAPGYFPGQPDDEPMVLKFRAFLCNAKPRH